MSRSEEHESIIEALAGGPEAGLSLSEIDANLRRRGLNLSRRTLQRRLPSLADQGHIQVVGSGAGTRYRLPESEAFPDSDWLVPLSPDAREVYQLVTRPVIHRRPVPYHPEFLWDYEPGETWYLAEGVRGDLHDSGRTPLDKEPAGTYARAILDRLLIDLSWASSHLEGNTYSLLDTRNLIEFGQRAEGRDALEAQMILNHKHAIEMLVEQAADVTLSPFTVRNLHAALAEELLPEPTAEGRLRRQQVQISGSVFTPLGVPQQIEEYFGLLLQKAAAIPDPFEQAFFLLVHLPYLQPFDDVNKRVSRVGANLPLIRDNLCPLSFLDVPRDLYVAGVLGVYELNRVELLRDVFVWAYHRSSEQYKAVRQTLSAPSPFRIRHREQMARVLREVIRTGSRPGRPTIRERAGVGLAKEDIERFVEMTLEELLALHEGNITRYRIGIREFETWRALWSAG